MPSYILKRLLQGVSVLIIVCSITFLMIHSAPGGPAVLLSEHLSEADRAILRAKMGLDQPLLTQFVKWVGSIMQLDFGLSFSEGMPVLDLLGRRLPNTLYLASASFLFSCIIGIPLGVLSAIRRHKPIDHFATFISLLGVSMPVFWLALLCIILFSVQLGWLPSSGMGPLGGNATFVQKLKHLVMPMFALSVAPIAEITRYTRSSMLDALSEDYVRTAKAKGLRNRSVLFKHTLRNAFNPILTILGLTIPPLVGGSVIVEMIFAWPGMGRLAVDAALKRDYPVMMGLTVVIAMVVVIVNLIVDLLYGALDPRVRVSNDAK